MSERPADGGHAVVHEVADEAADVELAEDAELETVDHDPAEDADVQVQAAEAEQVRTEVSPTGDERVDAALERLPELDRLPTAEHVAVYEDLHRSLQDALGAAAGGSGSGGSAPASPRPAVPGPPRR